MKTRLAFLLILALAGAACHRHPESAAPDHPLKGVIVDVIAEPPALVVNHEEIPGVMAAMTMQFEVDAATAATAKKGQKISARLRYTGGHWKLEDVHLVTAP